MYIQALYNKFHDGMILPSYSTSQQKAARYTWRFPPPAIISVFERNLSFKVRPGLEHANSFADWIPVVILVSSGPQYLGRGPRGNNPSGRSNWSRDINSLVLQCMQVLTLFRIN